MDVKENSKRSAYQIEKLADSKEAPESSDSDVSRRVPSKNNERTGVLPTRKQQGKKTPKHSITHSYCILFKKAGIPESKWKLHSSDNYFGKSSYQATIKDVLEGGMGNKANAVNNDQKS